MLALLLLGPPGLSATWEDADWNSQVRSLTNKVRAYELRVKSMQELLTRDPEKTFPLLVSLLKDRTEGAPLRYLAAEKMVEADRRQALDTFQKILDNRKEDPFARRSSFTQLLRLLNQDQTRKKIETTVDDPSEDPAIRQYALSLYSEGRQDKKIEKLRSFARSKQETLSLRTNALFLLESLGDLDFVRSMIHQSLNNRMEPEELRKNGAVMAERINDSDSIPLLEKIAHHPQESSTLKQLAASLLKQMRGKEKTG